MQESYVTQTKQNRINLKKGIVTCCYGGCPHNHDDVGGGTDSAEKETYREVRSH